ILWYGGYEVMHGYLGAAELIAFFTLLLTIMNPLGSLSKLSTTLHRALAAAERIFELMEINNPKFIETKSTKVLDEVKGYLEFQDVSFAYNENKEVLSGISFKVEPGEILALVGPSGAGKTTIADLIP